MIEKRYPFREVVDKYGPPVGDGPIGAAEAERYRGRVPDALVDFWLEYGRGSWRDGLFWLCDPEPLMPIIRELFRNDPEFDSELMVPYFRDAFGDISAWHPKMKLVSISMNLGEVGTTDITVQVIDGQRPFDDNMAVASPVAGALFHDDGWEDAVEGTPVFDAVLARLGPIDADQVYVMTPHFLLGGSGVAEDFSIGGLVEYLGFLLQIGPFTCMRYIPPEEGGRKPFGHSEPVRTIGYDRLIDAG